MTGKRIIIELDENESCDSYAMDMAIEKVRHFVVKGFKKGKSPLWYIEDIEVN